MFCKVKTVNLTALPQNIAPLAPDQPQVSINVFVKMQDLYLTEQSM